MSLPEQVGRGVYTAPYLSAGGNMVLVSVTSTGRRFMELEVPPGDNPYPILEMMWQELNAQDPPATPALKLMPAQITATIAAGIISLIHIADPIVLRGHIF